MDTNQCLNCGREINGPFITTPDGDTYHYKCVDVSYPEPCMTDDVMGNFTPDGTGEETIKLFKYLQQNPYDIAGKEGITESLPEVNVTINSPVTLDICLLGNEVSWDVYHRTESIDMSSLLFQAVYFGCALEREFPAFADEDHLHPNGESRTVTQDVSSD